MKRNPWGNLALKAAIAAAVGYAIYTYFTPTDAAGHAEVTGLTALSSGSLDFLIGVV